MLEGRTEVEQGYWLLKSQPAFDLSSEQVAFLQNADYLGDGVGLKISDTMKFPGIEKLVFSEPLVELLRSLLGNELSIFPNLTIRRNSTSPWHMDEAFRSGRVSWGDPEQSSFVQVTVYFQNYDENGGGLDVIPGSHRLDRIPANKRMLPDLAKMLVENNCRIESKLGDTVLWDGRLLHRSGTRTEHGRPNYALHWTVSNNASDRRGFLHHLINRGRTEKDHIGVDRRYGEIERYRFARDAPATFLRALNEQSAIELFDIDSIDTII